MFRKLRKSLGPGRKTPQLAGVVPGASQPQTPRGDDLSLGLEVLETIIAVCDGVDEVAAKHSLKKAPMLKRHSENIKELVDRWDATDFEFLEGEQRTKLMAALNSLHQALKKPHEKVRSKSKKKLIFNKRKLFSSLQLCLQQVNTEYQIFQKAVEALLKDDPEPTTEPPAQEPERGIEATSGTTPAAATTGIFVSQSDSFLPSPIKAAAGVNRQSWSSSDEEDYVGPTQTPRVPDDGGPAMGDEELEELEDGLDTGAEGPPSSGSLDSGEASVSDIPLVSPKEPGGRDSTSSSGLPPGYRLNLEGVALHGGHEAAALPTLSPQRRRKGESSESRQGKAPKGRGREKGDQSSRRHRKDSKERREEAGRGGGHQAPAFNGFVSQSGDFPQEVQDPSYAGMHEGTRTKGVSWGPSSAAAAAAREGAAVPGHTTSSWVAKQAAGMQQEEEPVPAEITQLRELVAAADGGDPAAALELGMLLREGQVIERDPVEAMEYLRIAAEAGDPEACYMVGCMAGAGEGLAAPDLQEAASWYRRAACQGHPEASAAFGQALEHGVATNQNLRAAAAWYRKAALSGSARGANNLGKLFFDGRGVSQDPSKAVAWFKYATKCKGEGCPAAFNNLGICFEDGLGAPQDATAAESCYQKAADQGHLGAMLNLAYLQFDRGDMPSARMSFEMAASRGNPDALYSLACIVERQAAMSELVVQSSLEEGRDVRGEGGQEHRGASDRAAVASEEGHVNAGHLYQKAAAAGDSRAQHKLGAWYWDEGWVDDALVMFHMAAAQQHAPSLNALGIIAEEGQGGCEKDLKAAWECYRLAALHGSADAEANLRSLEEVMESSHAERALQRSGFQLGVVDSSADSEGLFPLPKREPLVEYSALDNTRSSGGRLGLDVKTRLEDRFRSRLTAGTA